MKSDSFIAKTAIAIAHFIYGFIDVVKIEKPHTVSQLDVEMIH